MLRGLSSIPVSPASDTASGTLTPAATCMRGGGLVPAPATSQHGEERIPVRL